MVLGCLVAPWSKKYLSARSRSLLFGVTAYKEMIFIVLLS